MDGRKKLGWRKPFAYAENMHERYALQMKYNIIWGCQQLQSVIRMLNDINERFVKL